MSQVDFRDDAEELEAEDDGGGPKRAVHGRKATAFVKAKAVGVGSPMGAQWATGCGQITTAVIVRQVRCG